MQSSNFTNIDQKLQDINITAYETVYITDQGIQVTPNDIDTDQSDKDSRATCKEPLYVWDNASNSVTDFNTYFLFVIGSDENVDYGDGLTFFLVPYDSTLNITKGGAIGLPANQITGEAISPFVLLWSLIPIEMRRSIQLTLIRQLSTLSNLVNMQYGTVT
ncbi:hypothetical protein LOK49_LG12G00393 [Camellia lanceoleosa]|uniref:Uncharacterized protein n=1 Tax=Camellia lanceoleosa TaxID=1840588 RepID=A0ACC0FV26_9ERIC|nr:hypothetical protein LOK49_LG12G00393 [Camellia lanceoleosa]